MGRTLNCKICGCSWNLHMHTTYDCERFERNTVDDDINKLITDKDSAILAIERHVVNIESACRRTQGRTKKIYRSLRTVCLVLKNECYSSLRRFNTRLFESSH